MKSPLHLPIAGVTWTVFTNPLVPRDQIYGAVWDEDLRGYRVADKIENPSAFVMHPATAKALESLPARNRLRRNP